MIDLVRAHASEAEERYALDEALRGTRPARVARRLVDNGLDADAAASVARRAAGLVAGERRRAARKTMLYGVGWFAVGVGMTVWGEHNAVASGGGSYKVFVGAIVLGGIQFLEGFRRLVVAGGGGDERPRSNYLERCAGRGMLLGMAAGAAVGGVYGYAAAVENPPASAVAGVLLGPIPGLFVGLAAGCGYAVVRWLAKR